VSNRRDIFTSDGGRSALPGTEVDAMIGAATLVVTESDGDAMRPRVLRWTDHYIDRIIESGHCDLIYDVALPVPALSRSSVSDGSLWRSGAESARCGTTSSACPYSTPRQSRPVPTSRGSRDESPSSYSPGGRPES
jgi:hypothetical protein